MKQLRRKLLYLILTASVMLGAMSTPEPALAASKDKPDKMEVHFLDVGQGDSALVTCGDSAMLIDAGDDSKGTAIQNYLKKRGVSKLDYLVLTHPDADHIGGAPVIVTKFKIGKVFVSNFEKDNQTYRKLVQSLDDKRLKALTPKVNSKYSLGSAAFTILAPNDVYDTPNDSSIALLLQNGKNTFLFTGDAGEDAEKDILENNASIAADVYKVGHHGSKYSTSKAFFEAVDPDYAVISCGEGNSYGHPHAKTLNTLRANGVKVYRTDESGAIVATSDGKAISFNVPPSDSWKAGEPTGSAADKKAATKQSVKTGAAAKQSAQSGTAAKQSAEAAPPSVAPAAQPTVEGTEAIAEAAPAPAAPVNAELTFVLNSKTKKFHKPSCSFLPTTNRVDSSEGRDSVVAQGYVPCKKCNP